MDIDLSFFFRTKAQANDFSSRLATISQKIYETNFSLETACMQQFGIQKKDVFMTMIRDNAIDITSNSALKTFLDMLQEKIAALPILGLTIAYEPSDDALHAISEWFLLNMKMQILFDVTVDPACIAGAKFTFNGKYSDMTITTKFHAIINTMLTPSTETHGSQLSLANQDEHQSSENLHIGR